MCTVIDVFEEIKLIKKSFDFFQVVFENENLKIFF